ATTVALNDPIPAGMTFVSATQTSSPPPAFACTDPGVGNGGTVNCTAPSMLPGQSATFSFVFNIPPATPPGTPFTNIATGSATNPDPNEENNSSATGTTTPPPPSADMNIFKTGPNTAGPDTDVTFTISVSNSGP